MTRPGVSLPVAQVVEGLDHAWCFWVWVRLIQRHKHVSDGKSNVPGPFPGAAPEHARESDPK